MRWNEGNDCVPICLPQRMSEGSKERRCHCKSDKHLGGAGTRFHRTPSRWRSPHSHVPLAASGSWRLGIPFSPGDPAVSGRMEVHKGQVPVGFNVSLHRAPSSCCLGWRWCIWHPPYFFLQPGWSLMEPAPSQVRKASVPAGQEEDVRCKDNCQGPERKSEIGAGQNG